MEKITDEDVLELARAARRNESSGRESFSEFRRKFLDYLRSRGRLVEQPHGGLRPLSGVDRQRRSARSS